MVLRPQTNLVEIPSALTLISSQLQLQASSAMLDIDKNRYQFTRVKATHHSRKIGGEAHEAS